MTNPTNSPILMAEPIPEPTWVNSVVYNGTSSEELQEIIDRAGAGSGNETVIFIEREAVNVFNEIVIRAGQTIKLVASYTESKLSCSYRCRCIHIVGPGSTLFLEKTEITGGVADYGGGVLNEGKLVFRDVPEISRCSASISGGAVYNSGAESVLSVQRCSVRTCTANDDGGGFYIPQGSKFYGITGGMRVCSAGMFLLK